MKTVFLFSLLCFFTSGIQAKTLQSKGTPFRQTKTSDLLMQTLFGVWEEELPRSIDDLDAFRLLDDENRPIETEEVVTIKKKSRGESIVEKKKAEIRAKLAKKRAEEESAKTTKASTSFAEEMRKNRTAWSNEVRKTRREFAKEVRQMRREWKKQKMRFEKNKDEILKTTFEAPKENPPQELKASIIEKKIDIIPQGRWHMVNASLIPPVDFQGERPTCAAFAGLEGIETLLSQHEMDWNLSEQYFFYASRPDCQKGPCSTPGSYAQRGLLHSQKQSSPDIPTEESCAYQPDLQEKNQTQLPLGRGCLGQGVVKVGQFVEVKTLDELIASLEAHRPVVMSIKASDNFLSNNGVVTAKGATFNNRSPHKSGHAVLVVGYLNFPKQTSEGNMCFVVKNSWGIGWGQGGYACVTEAWMRKNRKPNPGIAPVSLMAI